MQNQIAYLSLPFPSVFFTVLCTCMCQIPACVCVSNPCFSSKLFEPRSISSLSSVIVRVSVVLKRTVGDSDFRMFRQPER